MHLYFGILLNLFITKTVFHKTLIDGLESCGLLWCFFQLFDYHSDGTHLLHIFIGE